MKLILDNNQLNQAPEQLLRQAGYAYLIDRNTGQESFVRGLGRGFYPRFHLYLVEQNGQVTLNLHLDQKQASYAGAHAHNAEYDGGVVAAEMERIKNLMAQNSSGFARSGEARQLATQNTNLGTGQGILDKIRPKQFAPAVKKEGRKGWWRKLFS